MALGRPSLVQNIIQQDHGNSVTVITDISIILLIHCLVYYMSEKLKKIPKTFLNSNMTDVGQIRCCGPKHLINHATRQTGAVHPYKLEVLCQELLTDDQKSLVLIILGGILL